MNVYGVVFVFVWHVHGECVWCCVRVCVACARCVWCVDGVVCSGKATDERNRERVVLDPLSNFNRVKSTRKHDPQQSCVRPWRCLTFQLISDYITYVVVPRN